MGRWIYDDDDYLPKVCPSLRDDDVFTAITCDFANRQLKMLAWARLEPDDKITFGTVSVAGGDETQAANELNEHVGSSIVNREIKLGKNAVEEFYCRARVMPTWRRLAGGHDSVVDVFAIPVGEGLGFRPYRPVFQRLPAEARARRDVEELRLLRWASRICRTQLMERQHEHPMAVEDGA